MSEMDGMDAVTFVSTEAPAKESVVDPQCKAIMDKVEAGLKGVAAAKNIALVGKPLQTKEEAKKKARYLRAQIRRMGSAYAKYAVTVKGSDGAGYQLSVMVVKKRGKRASKSGVRPASPVGGDKGYGVSGQQKQKAGKKDAIVAQAAELQKAVEQQGQMQAEAKQVMQQASKANGGVPQTQEQGYEQIRKTIEMFRAQGMNDAADEMEKQIPK